MITLKSNPRILPIRSIDKIFLPHVISPIACNSDAKIFAVAMAALWT